MANFNSVNYLFAAVFVMIGGFMLILGGSVLFAGPQNETEWTIALMSIISAAFLFYGAKQTWQSARAKEEAERKEANRLQQKFQAQIDVSKDVLPTTEFVVDAALTSAEADVKKSKPTSPEAAMPEILVRWTYAPKEWNQALAQLAKKTKQEEMYTAFWFPVLFTILMWQHAVYAFIAGIAFGALYIWFRMYWVKRNFTMKPGAKEAEVIISDSYLRINGNFIHYADGHYYLKELSRDKDPKLGDYLLFNIGWTTSKGLPAQMDVYLPISADKESDAELILAKFKAARL